MRLTRKELAAMGIDEDKIELIVNAHAEAIDGINAELKTAKADAARLKEVQKELDSLKEASEKDPFKVKYEAMKEEYENFKKGVEDEKVKAGKADAYRAMLKKIGVAEKRIEAVLKVTDLDGLELDEKGILKKADELEKAAREEWSDFIVKKQESGKDTETPPGNNGGKGAMTRDEIMRITDRAERRKAMAEHPEAFSQLADLAKE